MKLSLFSNVLLASMMIFAVGCGKDSKKKNTTCSVYDPYNPVCSSSYTSGIATSGQPAKDALSAYANAVEPKFIYQQIVIQKKRYSCSTKDFLGINFLPYEKCSSSSLPVEYSYSLQGQSRVTINPLLGSLLTPPVGYTLGNVYQQGQYIFVDHVSSNGVDTIQYLIDTAQHADVNPIQVKDTALKQIDYVYSSNI